MDAKAIGVDSMTPSFLGALFALTFVFNLAWEFAHVRLYSAKVSNLFLTWQSLKDALWITLAFIIAPNTAVFVGVLFLFSYGVELHALRSKRWEYTPTMPLVFGVGLSPLLELAVTGVVAVVVLKLLGV